jgi:hypothetical protein
MRRRSSFRRLRISVLAGMFERLLRQLFVGQFRRIAESDEFLKKPFGWFFTAKNDGFDLLSLRRNITRRRSVAT